jgi:hypothetical protein
MFPAGQDVVVYREDRNRLGDLVIVEEQVLHGCGIAPRTSSELGGSYQGLGGTSGRTTVTTGLTLYAPVGSHITARHRVRLADGTVWQVQGDPGHWHSPLTGWSPGVVVELDRVVG